MVFSFNMAVLHLEFSSSASRILCDQAQPPRFCSPFGGTGIGVQHRGTCRLYMGFQQSVVNSPSSFDSQSLGSLTTCGKCPGRFVVFLGGIVSITEGAAPALCVMPGCRTPVQLPIKVSLLTGDPTRFGAGFVLFWTGG